MATDDRAGEPAVEGWATVQEPPPWAVGDMPNPDLFMESELFCAGALSTLPPFTKYHPAWALPHARQVLEALMEWEPTDA